MKTKLYCKLTGIFFGLIAILHLLRLIYSWPVQIGSVSIPQALSIFGLLVGAVFSIWGFRVAKDD